MYALLCVSVNTFPHQFPFILPLHHFIILFIKYDHILHAFIVYIAFSCIFHDIDYKIIYNIILIMNIYFTLLFITDLLAYFDIYFHTDSRGSIVYSPPKLKLKGIVSLLFIVII